MQERDRSCAVKVEVDRHVFVVVVAVAVLAVAAGPELSQAHSLASLTVTAARDDVELCQFCHMYSQTEKHDTYSCVHRSS